MDEGIVKKRKKKIPKEPVQHRRSWFHTRCERGVMVAILMLTCLASGQTQTEMPWQYKAKTQLRPGEEMKFVFVPKKDLQSVKIEVFDGANQMQQRWVDKLVDAGESHTLKWAVSGGQSSWRVRVEVGESDGLSTANVDLKVVVARALEVTLAKADVDLVKGQVTVESNKPLKAVSIRYVTAHHPETKKTSFNPPPRGGRIVIPLPDIGDDRFRLLRFKFVDEAQQWIKTDVVNWYARIPHDDVVFESGQSTISAAERTKLTAVVAKIKREQKAFSEAVGRPGATLDLKLYIAGMTDTVGRAADNLKLSEARARAIADAFRAEGLRCPIFSAGFGESRLKVVTADGVDEARNRRAVYLLTNYPPRDLVPPSNRWILSP